MAWTLDPPIGDLRQQLHSETGVPLSEFGTIGDPDHAARTSAHNPESPPPAGNPDNEVDALDVPHVPPRLDCHVVTEALRLSRDPRLRLVIFDRRQFSSYDHADGDPYTWRPYHGDDPHTEHAHVERTDARRDDRRPWQTGYNDMDNIEHDHLIALAYRAKALYDDADKATFTLSDGKTRTEPNLAKTARVKLETRLAALESKVLAVGGDVAAVRREIEADTEEIDLEQLAADIAAQIGPGLVPALVEKLGTLQFVPATATPSV